MTDQFTLVDRIRAAYPDASFGLRGTNYGDLDWYGIPDPDADPSPDTQPTEDGKLTEAEFEALTAEEPPPPVDLLVYAGTAFKVRRDGGFTVNNMTIATDEESRGLIDGAYSLSQSLPDHVFDFRAVGGWANLDAATIQTIAIGVGLWVQACYTARRLVEEGIEAGTITTTDEIDDAFAAVALPG